MKRKIFYLIAAAFAGFAILLFITILLKAKKPPSNLIVASGMIEADEVEISFKIGGKIEKLFVKEGDELKKRDPIAYLDAKDIKAKVEQARAKLKMLEQEVERTKEAYILTKEVVKREIQQAKAALDAAEAKTKEAKANFIKAEKDWIRYSALFKKGVISKREKEHVETAYNIAKAEFEASRKNLERAKAALKVAIAKQRKIKIAKARMLSTKNALKEAKAALEEAISYLEDTKIYSPINGAVIEKLAEEGEVVSAGTSVVVLANLDALYLKVYIPETKVGKVALGQPARVYTDAYPEKPFPAKVCYVAKRAEFTPKEVQTYEERVQYTFAVKLCIEKNEGHILKPGMPADGVIKIAPGAWWNPIKKK